MARKRAVVPEARGAATNPAPPPARALDLAAGARKGDDAALRELAAVERLSIGGRPGTVRVARGSVFPGLRGFSAKGIARAKHELPVEGLAAAFGNTLFFRGIQSFLVFGIDDGRRFEMPCKRSTADWPTDLLLPLGDEIVLGDVRLGWLERRSAEDGALRASAEIAEPLGFGFSWGAAGDRLAGAPKSGKEIIAYDLGAELGKDLWRKGGFKKVSTVRVTGSHVYVSDDSNPTLHVLSLEDGRLLWEGNGSVDDADSVGALQGAAGWLKELDAKTGADRWTWSPQDGSLKRSAFGTESVFVARTRTEKTHTTTPDGGSQVSVTVHNELAAIDRATGKPRFETRISADTKTIAVASDVGYAGFAKEDGAMLLRAVDLATGRELFAADLPLDASGRVTLLPGDGRLDVIGINDTQIVMGRKGSASSSVEIVTLRS